MLDVRIEGWERLQAGLRRTAKAAIQGVADGANRTLRAVEQHELVAMERDIDRPTPFTMNAFRLAKARPSKMEAVLYIQPLQAKYLSYAIRGGVLPKVMTPVLSNIKLNQYGNIVGKRKGLKGIAKGKRFIARIGGKYGVWVRQGGKLKPLVIVEKQARREKRWDLYGIAERVINQRLMKDINEEVGKAIRAAAGGAP